MEKNKIAISLLTVGLLVVLAVLFIVPVVHGVTYTNQGNIDLKVTLVNQQPDPAEPESYVDLRFKVENWGTKQADNVTVELLPKFPFSLELGDSASKNIGNVWGMQIDEQGVIVKYRVRVDKNAVEGGNEIKLRYRTANQEPWIEVDPFQISIRTHNAILAIEQIKTEPDVIEPGKKGTVYIEVKNLADSVLRNIKIKIDLSSADIPLAPLGSISEKTIYQLSPNEGVFVNFDIMAKGDAKCNIYKVPVRIDYQDRLGQNFTKSDITGIVVCGTPVLDVMIEKADFAKAPTEISIKLINRDITDIKFLTVKLDETKNFELASPPTVYIGSIDSDDYETADFKINIHRTKDKEIVLPFTITYKDANNNDYKVQKNLVLKLQKTKKSNTWAGVLIVLIIAVAMYFIYKRFCKKKHP